MSKSAVARKISGSRPRETRKPVNLDARMRMEKGWCDIAIRNISSGGFMAQCNRPPRRGYYIEVWRGEVCIVGYVVWTTGSRFGVRTQEKIDISALIAKRKTGMRGTERRKRERQPGTMPLSLQAQAERSRLIGRTLHFAALGVVAVAAAVFLASAVGRVLGKPVAEINASLSGATARAATAHCRSAGIRDNRDPGCVK